MVSRLTGVALHDHNCGMKCYRREVLQEVRLYGELHRFVPVLAAGRGFRIDEISIEHRARRFGKSKYGVSRFIKGFLDLLTVRFLTGYGQRPQHFLGTVGLLSFLLGGLVAAFLAAEWVVSHCTGPDTLVLALWSCIPPLRLLYAIAFLLMGGQFMSIGFVAELFVAYPLSRRFRPIRSVRVPMQNRQRQTNAQTIQITLWSENAIRFECRTA